MTEIENEPNLVAQAARVQIPAGAPLISEHRHPVKMDNDEHGLSKNDLEKAQFKHR